MGAYAMDLERIALAGICMDIESFGNQTSVVSLRALLLNIAR